MANPNPHKQQRYVDMPKVILKAFPQGYKPRVRPPGEALGPQISVMELPVYKPEPWPAPVR